MSKFKLDKQKAKIVNVNLRKEAAGEETGATLATDIKLECEDLPAAALKALCPVDTGAQLTFADALFSDQGVPGSMAWAVSACRPCSRTRTS